ncbi:MAG: hypothetical protein Q9209_007164 [Squamulea sp. 1 TL-2023]
MAYFASAVLMSCIASASWFIQTAGSASAWCFVHTFGTSITVYKKEAILFGDVESYLANAQTWRSQMVNTMIDPKKHSYPPSEGLHVFWKERAIFKRADIGEETEYITFWKIYLFQRRDDWGPRLIQKCRQLGQQKKGTLTFTAGQKHRRSRGFETWREITDRQKQYMSSWIGKEGLRDVIQQDLEQWIADEDYYQKVNRTYKRCYCLSGPAGTGKNTCVYAIAGELNLNVYSINATTMSDTEIVEILPDLPNRCIIFLEEVDTALKESDKVFRQSPEVGMTRSLLHSFLDGSLTLAGKLVILTVNDFDVLGGTMSRPGRIDRHFALTLATKTMAKELFIQFMGPRYKQQEGARLWPDVQDLAGMFAEHLDDGQHTPAQIASFLTQYRTPHTALKEVSQLKCQKRQKDC